MNSLDWSGGMDYWSGVLDWTTGVGGAIFLSMRIIINFSSRQADDLALH